MRFTMDSENYITLSSDNEDEDDDEVQFVGKFQRGPYIIDLEQERKSSKPESQNHQRHQDVTTEAQLQPETNNPRAHKNVTISEPSRPEDDRHQKEEEPIPSEPPRPDNGHHQNHEDVITSEQPGPNLCDQHRAEDVNSRELPELEEPSKPIKRPLSDRELMIAKKELGNKKFRSNSFNDAIRCYREAIVLSKKVSDDEMTAILHFNLAMSYDRIGSYAQAADECAEAVKINDQYLKAHVKRAEIYMARGKYDEAVICYEHICEIDSTKRHDALQRIAKAKALSAQLRKPDQYEILGLRPHFTAEQLRAAYKQKARAHHPDRHSDADIVTRRIHEKIFKEASEANAYFRKRYNYH